MGQIKVEYNVNGINGLCVIKPALHGDSRGYFMETYNANDMKVLAAGEIDHTIDELYQIKNKKMWLKNPFNKNSSIFTVVQTKLLATLFLCRK